MKGLPDFLLLGYFQYLRYGINLDAHQSIKDKANMVYVHTHTHVHWNIIQLSERMISYNLEQSKWDWRPSC